MAVSEHARQPDGGDLFGGGPKSLGAVLARHPQVLVLSDEIYEHIIFDGRAFVSFGQACPELKDRSLIVNGVSKAYAMTGWRVGYAAGPAPLVKAMATIQSQSVTSVSSIAQAATVAALNGPQDEVSPVPPGFRGAPQPCRRRCPAGERLDSGAAGRRLLRLYRLRRPDRPQDPERRGA